MSSSFWRRGFIYLLLLVGGIILITSFLPAVQKPEAVSLNSLLTSLRSGEIARLEQQRDTLVAFPLDKTKPQLRVFFVGTTVELYTLLQKEGVNVGPGGVEVVPRDVSRFNLGSLLTTLLPLLFLGFILFFFLQRAQGANSQAFNFARSRARMFTVNRPNVTFLDVAGVDEAKQELQEVVEFLKTPAKFQALGARIPRGVLLIGPPGTGKTLLARAVAGEAEVPFFSISGSEFGEMFVGVGASRVRDLFDQAKRNAPSIVFVDEIDAVGRQRGAGLGGGHDEREQTLNQILVEMDGFDNNTNIIVVAATNRPDILDPALLRPGRFDRQVTLDRPDIKGRRAILDVHSKGKPLAPDVQWDAIARETSGFTGADLANLVNEAALLSARRNLTKVGMKEIEEAIDRVIAGPERKSRIISSKEKELAAYHEAGHALVAHILPDADPVHKVSIVSRGTMGGFTRLLPTEDRHQWTRSQFKATLAVLQAGRVAEELIFNELSTGAESDLSSATRLARSMVTEFGISDKLGPRTFGRKDHQVFLGRDIAEQRDYSEQVAQDIDKEIKDFINTAHEKSREVLTANRERLVHLAK
ncbi:MAG: ATP-dependent zinc metalloprotease FtsH, partial [Chloroflexota bacterium]